MAKQIRKIYILILLIVMCAEMRRKEVKKMSKGLITKTVRLKDDSTDSDPRVFLVIVPKAFDAGIGYMAKPVLIPKKMYVQVMQSMIEANKYIEELEDLNEVRSPTVMAHLSEILERTEQESESPESESSIFSGVFDGENEGDGKRRSVPEHMRSYQ